jgi:lysozyme
LLIVVIMAITLIQLKASAFTQATASIKQHEGFVSHPYKDNNHLSIGYGTNLSYLTEAEAELLLIHRLAIIQSELDHYQWYTKLTDSRKAVILDMAYNLGLPGFMKFKHLIWRLDNNYYTAASNAMLESKWCKQVGNRCRTLAKQMKQG